MDADYGIVFQLIRDHWERLDMFDSSLPYNPFRTKLYSVDELMQGYDGRDPETALDAKIGKYYNDKGGNSPKSANVALGERIHDHAIDVALNELIKDLKIVGIMGGHSAKRNDPLYGSVARLGKMLASEGYTVTTGGGPGVMEAANLGAYMVPHSDEDLAQAIEILKKAPSYEDNDDGKAKYIEAALEVRKKFPSKGIMSLSVPTWAYSNEPTGQFASHIAKYFANSIREDGLLAMGTYGVIFAKGSAGTLQEIFQDVAHNSYKTFGYRAAMVFFGKEFYTASPSIFHVVKNRAAKDDPAWDRFLGVCDAPEEAVKFIVTHPPEKAGMTVARQSMLDNFLKTLS